jgi:hypothetical protein
MLDDQSQISGTGPSAYGTSTRVVLDQSQINKGGDHLRSRWDFLALKSTILAVSS